MKDAKNEDGNEPSARVMGGRGVSGTLAATDSMLKTCMRQIFEAQDGEELVGASRLARALAEQSAFDDLVVTHQPVRIRPWR